MRFAELVERDRDELAALVAEVGKLRAEAEGEPDWTAASARWYAQHLPGTERRGTVGVGAEIVARAPALNEPRLDGAAFFPATLVRGVPVRDLLRRQELFAPVLSVETFDHDDDAWRIANDTQYGLAAAVYTSSKERAGAAQEWLDVGVVGVNQRCDSVELEAPFGGTKSSGNGFPEGGEYAYSGVTVLKAVYGAPARP